MPELEFNLKLIKLIFLSYFDVSFHLARSGPNLEGLTRNVFTFHQFSQRNKQNAAEKILR